MADESAGMPDSTPARGMSPWLDRIGALARWLLLLLLAGHLLFRREFAHRNLGELFGATQGWLARAYVTEVTLLVLLPAAVVLTWRRMVRGAPVPPDTADAPNGLGASFVVALAFLLLGSIHAVAALYGAGSTYLVLRQSAMIGYAVAFLYAFLFFGDRALYVRQAVLWALLVSLVCAGLDAVGLLKPPPDTGGFYADESVYGQQTLPVAILGLGLFVVEGGSGFWRLLALAALLFVGWRQSLRVPQSVVPIGIGGAMLLYLLLGGAAALRGQLQTLKRAVLLAAFFGIVLLVYRGTGKVNKNEATELRAWSPQVYRELFDLYDSTTVPEEPNRLYKSSRVDGAVLRGLEENKLEAVYRIAKATGGDSVVNNIWRLLMWRHMFDEWRSGNTWLGVGVGKAWEYNEAFKHTHFHYEQNPGGLNPHNSYLNLLYRYGVVGLALLAALFASVLYVVWKALLVPPGNGDILLEALALFFFYAALFAFFTVTLEGPSYSLPLWASLGLLYARARQRREAHEEPLR